MVDKILGFTFKTVFYGGIFHDIYTIIGVGAVRWTSGLC